MPSGLCLKRGQRWLLAKFARKRGVSRRSERITQELMSLWFGIAAVPIIGKIEKSHENDESEDELRQAPGNETKAQILAAMLGLKSVPVRKIEKGDAGAVPRTSSCYSKPDSTFMIPVVIHIRMLPVERTIDGLCPFDDVSAHMI